jgi:hypothetical protein
VGIKQTLAARDDPLDAIVAVALGSGVAMYYAALAAIRVRRGARPQTTQLALVVIGGLVMPGATRLPAIASLAVLAVAITIQASIGGATTATGVPDCLSRPAPTAPGRPPRSA